MSKINRWSMLAMVALVAILTMPIAADAKTVNILPLGDSITSGKSTLQSYRYPLFKKLVDSKRPYAFIGTQTSNYGGNPSFPSYNGVSFVNRHEGHWGWTANKIITYLPTWLNGYSPDIVILNIGSNDVGAGDSTSQIASEIERIIDLLRGKNPGVHVLLMNSLPTTTTRSAGHYALSIEIPKLVVRKTTVASPVRLVDSYTGFSTSWLADGIHPNSTGEAYIAGKIMPVLAESMDALGSIPPVPPSPIGLYRAINFNGGELEIDGMVYESMSAAGVTHDGKSFANQTIALNPATDSARATMIRSSIYRSLSTGLSVKVPGIPSDLYDIYVYVWEDNYSVTANLAMEGVTVKTGIVTGAAGRWQKLGPFRVNVIDGALDVKTSGGTLNLSGIEIHVAP